MKGAGFLHRYKRINVKDFNVDQVRVMTAKKIWGNNWEEMISTPEGYQQILNMTYTTSDPKPNC